MTQHMYLFCLGALQLDKTLALHVLRTECIGPGVAGEPGRQRVHQLWHQPRPLCLTHLYVPPGSSHVTEVISLHLE